MFSKHIEIQKILRKCRSDPFNFNSEVRSSQNIRMSVFLFQNRFEWIIHRSDLAIQIKCRDTVLSRNKNFAIWIYYYSNIIQVVQTKILFRKCIQLLNDYSRIKFNVFITVKISRSCKKKFESLKHLRLQVV